MIMKNLAFSKKVIFAIFAVLFTYFSWGQEPIDLSYSIITINDNAPYLCTGSTVTIQATDIVVLDYDTEEPVTSGFSISIVDSEDNPISFGDPITIGQYTLTITASDASCDGEQSKNFYVMRGVSDYYTISNADDWDMFAASVDDGYDYIDKTVKLNANNITVSKIVGGENWEVFKGTFNGNGNTLTFSYTAADEYDTGIAPFYYLDGATVSNLTIDGAIYAKGGMVAGLAYYNYSGTINNVTIGLDIIAEEQYWCGGFAYESDGENYTNCIYNGKIVAGSQCCGFTVTAEDVTFSNCLFDPEEGSSIKSGKVFGEGASFSTCYYTDNLGITSQGTKVYYNPTEFVGKKVSAFPDYCTPVNVAVAGVDLTYSYDSETNYYSAIMSAVTVTSDDPSLTYSVSIHDKDGATETVTDKGDYAVVVTGTGNYVGSFKKYFYVVGDIALQDPSSAYNATTNPYVITSTADWIKLSENVSAGTGVDLSYKLTADITVSDMVGTEEHPFSGIFSGRVGSTNNIHTITFNYGTSVDPTTDEIVAPFRYTDGATIEYLRVSGAIYTSVGKEAGLIGVNTSTTTVRYIIVDVNLYCDEELWDEEGGGFAYDGRGIHFSSSAYQGIISAENYHGGFCGKADNTTEFSNCLFNPAEGGLYWAENFVWNNSGAAIGSTCYYTEGNNQEESEQGTLVYVVYAGHSMPDEIIGKKLTNLYGRDIYEPVNVVISGVNKRYTYTGNPITVAPTAITFNGVNALTNNYCEWSIDPSPVNEIGTYTFTVTAPKQGVASEYLGTVTQLVRVVSGTSNAWTQLQAALSGSDSTIEIDADIEAGADDVCLVVESGRTVTINLNGHKIDRGFYHGNDTWLDVVIGGHVLKVNSGATVIINGGTGGKITGGSNKAASTAEHGENNDGGGIFNMGSLTLNNVTIEGNYCEKKTAGVSRTARGGGIYSGSGSTLIVNNCTVTHNEAKGGGGGLYAEKAAVFMMDGTNIRSNRSQDKGGGIRVDATNTKHLVGNTLVANALLHDCVIENNTVELHNNESASNGGGIHLDAGTLDLTDCTVQTNRSSKYGGGIYMMGGNINASNCNISFNSSYDSQDLFEGYGGGVCILGGTFKMAGGTITGNSSYISNGGGIFVASGKTLQLEGSVNINDNWTYENSSITNRHTTNVYLVGRNDKITISGNLEGASVGVSKNGGTGRFTNGLNGRGTVANFVSDNETYQVLPDSGEAKLGTPKPWDDPKPDPSTNEIVISSPTTINTTVTESYAYTIVFTGDGCLIIGPEGVLTAKISNNDPLKLIIEDGGQVITNTTVAARVKKVVEKFNSTAPIDNWYLISSPINGPVVSTATNIVVLNPDMIEPTPGYDLYRFNEAATETDEHGQLLQWENYRGSHGDFTTLARGRGYLYRSCQDYTVTIDGNLNVGEVVNYTLTNKGTNVFKGFNIIGNPYSHNIKKGTSQAIPNTYLEGKYYVLNPTGCQWVLTDDGTIIPPLTGILVQANSSVGAGGQTLTISDIAASSSKAGEFNKAENANIWFTVANNKYEDKACVEFKQGHGLNKIAHMNEEAPMLYIHHNDEDFASVDMNPAAKQFDLYFEAATMGAYKLNIKPQGEYRYLHLIDKVAEKDIDLLEESEYSFIGSPSDNVDRFVVRLETSESSDNSVFAYQSGNEIVVCGEGELQVFDVMGRLVAQKRVNGVESVDKPQTTGVYIIKLNDKTQKIVID